MRDAVDWVKLVQRWNTLVKVIVINRMIITDDVLRTEIGCPPIISLPWQMELPMRDDH